LFQAHKFLIYFPNTVVYTSVDSINGNTKLFKKAQNCNIEMRTHMIVDYAQVELYK